MLKLKIPPVIIFFIFAGLMWVTAKYRGFTSLNYVFPRWLIIGLGIVGVIIGVLGLWEFYRVKTTVNPHKPQNTQTIVRRGIYRFSRNPMYLALLIALICWAMYLGNVLLFIFLPVYIWYMNKFQVKPEEEKLIQKFGDHYEGYVRDVRRWL